MIGWFGGCDVNTAAWSHYQQRSSLVVTANVALSVMTKTHLLGITPAPVLTTQH